MFENKVAVITGGASGIGKRIAEEFEKEGAKVCVIDRNAAPFYLTQLFLEDFAKGAAIVNISSSRDRMSQPETESYTAAKGGISALTHAMAVSLAGRKSGESVGHREYGDVSVFGEGRTYHRGEYLY